MELSVEKTLIFQCLRLICRLFLQKLLWFFDLLVVVLFLCLLIKGMIL